MFVSKILLFSLLICSLGAVASGQKTPLQTWESFKVIYNKNYANEKEESLHKETFLKNLQLIEEHNKKYDQGLVTYSVKINQRSDIPSPKYHINPQTKVPESLPISRRAPGVDVPDSIDWRDYGVVTPVKDQTFCNSCWAFAMTGTVEAHVAIYQGRINQSYSEQNLIDCVDVNFDCNHGLDLHSLPNSYQYIIDNGIDYEASYPYTSVSGNGCRYTTASIGARINGYVQIPEGDEEELKTVVGTIGPVTVTITTIWSFDAYSDGIYYTEDCLTSLQPFNHAVTVVGYGTDNDQDYWLVKNEWGVWFGQQGYIKMARNRDNNCGIATYAYYPTSTVDIYK